MNDALSQLVRISRCVGKDASLIQAGGGNTSAKTQDLRYMYIKASGTALKDMNQAKGWRKLDIGPLLSILEDESLVELPAAERERKVSQRVLQCCRDDMSADTRPSVEAHLHALLGRYVIHLHPVAVGAYVNSKDGRDEFERLFADEDPPGLWAPYTDPGLTLARESCRLIESYRQRHNRAPQIMFFEKHGLAVSADRPDEALQLVDKTIELCTDNLRPLPDAVFPAPPAGAVDGARQAISDAVAAVSEQETQVEYAGASDAVCRFMQHPDAEAMLATTGLNPDELVYANGPALWISAAEPDSIAEKIRQRRDKIPMCPKAYLVEGVGLFVAAESKSAQSVAQITDASLEIRMYAQQLGGLCTLTQREQDFIINWEAEAFRKKQTR